MQNKVSSGTRETPWVMYTSNNVASRGVAIEEPGGLKRLT